MPAPSSIGMVTIVERLSATPATKNRDDQGKSGGRGFIAKKTADARDAERAYHRSDAECALHQAVGLRLPMDQIARDQWHQRGDRSARYADCECSDQHRAQGMGIKDLADVGMHRPVDPLGQQAGGHRNAPPQDHEAQARKQAGEPDAAEQGLAQGRCDAGPCLDGGCRGEGAGWVMTGRIPCCAGHRAGLQERCPYATHP